MYNLPEGDFREIKAKTIKIFNERNLPNFWHRSCMCDKTNHIHGDEKCEVEFETSYSPDRPEIIYCETCYQQEIY